METSNHKKWSLITYKATRYKTIDFFLRKKGMAELACDTLNISEQQGKLEQVIRYNSAGEN